MKTIIYPEWTSWAMFVGLGAAIGSALGAAWTLFTGTEYQLFFELTLMMVGLASFLVALRKRLEISDLIQAEIPPEGEG